MKIYLILVLILILNPISDLQIITRIHVKADKIYIDNFDNLYVISGSSLIKYNLKGEKLFVFDNPFNENISFADVKNPMKILIYFENQNKLVFLDNKLSLIGDEINLESKNLYNDLLICESESGGFWLTDVSNKVLIKYTSDFKEEFRKDLFELNEIPDFLFSNMNSLFIKTIKGSVLVYDNLGNYNFKINKKIHSEFQVFSDDLHYFNKKNNSFISYNMNTGDSTIVVLQDTLSIQNVVYSLPYLFFNDNRNVYVSELINERKDKR